MNTPRRTDAEWRQILGHQRDTWQNIERQRNPEFTVREIITDPVKIHDAMSEEANEK